MTTITLPDDVAERLHQIARDEGRNVADVLREFTEDRIANERTPLLPLDDFIGMIDLDITDASSTVKETVRAHMLKKQGGSDGNPR